MSLSRSLNFSIFQSSNSSQKKEDFEEEDDDEDYDWGKYFQNLFLSTLTVAEAKTFANFLADKSCQWKAILLSSDWLNKNHVMVELDCDWLMEFKGRKNIQYLIHSIIQFVANKLEKTELSFNIPVNSTQSGKINFKFCCSVSFLASKIKHFI